MPRIGRSSASALRDDRVATHGDQARHARGERADAGHDQTVRRHRDPGVRGQDDLGPRLGQRPGRRVQVARAVVEDGDAGPGPTRHRAPLVDGMPVTRGSGSTAARSARASALNWPRRCGAGRGPRSASGARRARAFMASDSMTWRVMPTRRYGAPEPRDAHVLLAGRLARCTPRTGVRPRRPRTERAPRRAARPRRRIDGCPACRQARSLIACPSTIAVSSTLWWPSMCTSPVVLIVMSMSECRRSAVSMWS